MAPRGALNRAERGRWQDVDPAARDRAAAGGQVSYPHVLERRAGELWVTAGFASAKWFNDDPMLLGVKLSEEELRKLG